MSHARTVLSAILPTRRDLLLLAFQHLEDEHFTNEVERNLFKLLSKYYDVAGDVLPFKTLSDLLTRQGVEETKQLQYESVYTECSEAEVMDHEFKYAVDALRDARAKYMTGVAVTTTYEIMENGAEVDGVPLSGHRQAREYAYSQFALIDRLEHAEAAPEGDMRHEGEQMLADYAARKAGDTVAGIKSGINSIDNVNGGFLNGELALVCAYTGEGKSQLSTGICWDVAVNQGKNVFFATSETVREQVKRRLVARHSRLDQFGMKGGINVRDIRDGTLTEQGEEVFRESLYDLDKNPKYGKIYIAQIPRGATLGFLEARLRRQAEQWDIQLVVMDYLALLKPDRHRQTSREELGDILKDAKVMATSFYNGRGVPLISPWQMSQNAYKAALLSGQYQLANLADTSEAEKTPDQIIAMLRDQETSSEAVVQFLKNRDGEAPSPFRLDIDYRNAFLGDKAGVFASEGGADTSSDPLDFLDEL